jgi:CDGSH-type Zn-finger protein
MEPEDDAPSVEVVAHGPYRVRGLPVVRTAQVETEYGEPVAWAPDAPLEHGPEVRLCRCGASATKPFCDDACDRIGFDGTEVADHGPYEDRRYPYETDGGLTLDDDVSLCTGAGYCGDRFENVWAMLMRAADPAVRDRIRTMTALCPSGRIRTRIDDGPPEEPPYAPSVAAIADGPLWVRGGVQVVGADGEPYEVRNRQTLCRCGNSGNKPFCDGSHKQTGFHDG